MTGTHSIFEDFKFSFSEVIRTLKPGGRALITGFLMTMNWTQKFTGGILKMKKVIGIRI